MRAILIGAGRMGLTHMAQLNLITEFAIRWTVMEPSLPVRRGLHFFLPDTMLDAAVGSLDMVRGSFDFGVIASPTMHHQAAWNALRGRVSRLLVEKPLRIADPGPEILCGYVLLHHPLQQRMRALISEQMLVEIDLELNANTVTGPNRGWRGHRASGGGVVNEFGSHLLSLLVDLAGPIAEIEVEQARTIYSVDVPDIALLSGKTASGARVGVRMDWTDSTVRKPVYRITARLRDGRVVSHDFYELVNDGERLSIAALDSKAGVYLRGLEFTEQARFFLSQDRYPHHLEVAAAVDRLLEQLA